MEPILTSIAANIKPVKQTKLTQFSKSYKIQNLLRFVIWLATQTKQFLSLARMLTLSTNKLRNVFASLLGNSDAVSMEPIVTQVATHVEFGLVVWRSTNAVQFLLLIFTGRYGHFMATGTTMR